MVDVDWKTVPVYMMDFEGGPGSGVVEYGVVLLHGGAIRETRSVFCRPTGPISGRDQAVHGVGDSETRGEPPFSSHYALFTEFRRRGVFAAHNRHAENRFLKETWPLPPTVPDWRRGEGKAQEWGPWIDTLALYRSLFPGLSAYGLSDLTSLFHLDAPLRDLAERHCPIGRRKAHCALYDALASALLLLDLERQESLRDRMTLRWCVGISEGGDFQEELF